MGRYTENANIAANTLAAIEIEIHGTQRDRVLKYASSGINFPALSGRCDVIFDIIDSEGLEMAIGPHSQTWCTGAYIAEFAEWQFNDLEIPSVSGGSYPWRVRANIFNRNSTTESFFLILITDVPKKAAEPEPEKYRPQFDPYRLAERKTTLFSKPDLSAKMPTGVKE